MKGHLIHYKIKIGAYYLKRTHTVIGLSLYTLRSEEDQATMFPADRLPSKNLWFSEPVDKAYYEYYKGNMTYIEVNQ